jgi:hypothetical protein
MGNCLPTRVVITLQKMKCQKTVASLNGGHLHK